MTPPRRRQLSTQLEQRALDRDVEIGLDLGDVRLVGGACVVLVLFNHGPDYNMP